MWGKCRSLLTGRFFFPCLLGWLSIHSGSGLKHSAECPTLGLLCILFLSSPHTPHVLCLLSLLPSFSPGGQGGAWRTVLGADLKQRMGEKKECGVGTQYGGKGDAESAPGQRRLQCSRQSWHRWGGVRTSLMKGCFTPSCCALMCILAGAPILSPHSTQAQALQDVLPEPVDLLHSAFDLLLAFPRHFFVECSPLFPETLRNLCKKSHAVSALPQVHFCSQVHLLLLPVYFQRELC